MLGYILGIRPYKTNFADLSSRIRGKIRYREAKEKLCFSNGFSGNRKNQ